MTADDRRDSRRVDRNILEIVRKIVSRIKKFLRSIKSGLLQREEQFYKIRPNTAVTSKPTTDRWSRNSHREIRAVHSLIPSPWLVGSGNQYKSPVRKQLDQSWLGIEAHTS